MPEPNETGATHDALRTSRQMARRTSRTRAPVPDPYDRANDGWWAAHDRLFGIAYAARDIARIASKAQAEFRKGGVPDLSELEDELRRWYWDRGSLDVVREYFAAREQAAECTRQTIAAPQPDLGRDLR